MQKTKVHLEKLDKSLQRLDSLIKRKFSSSHMSNAKWIKLLKHCASFDESSFKVNFKLVHSDQINTSYTEMYEEQVDDCWFIEPWLYKEVEWLEFIFEGNNELESLVSYLLGVAKFPLNKTNSGYRVVAYS